MVVKWLTFDDHRCMYSGIFVVLSKYFLLIHWCILLDLLMLVCLFVGIRIVHCYKSYHLENHDIIILSWGQNMSLWMAWCMSNICFIYGRLHRYIFLQFSHMNTHALLSFHVSIVCFHFHTCIVKRNNRVGIELPYALKSTPFPL